MPQPLSTHPSEPLASADPNRRDAPPVAFEVRGQGSGGVLTLDERRRREAEKEAKAFRFDDEYFRVFRDWRFAGNEIRCKVLGNPGWDPVLDDDVEFVIVFHEGSESVASIDVLGSFRVHGRRGQVKPSPEGIELFKSRVAKAESYLEEFAFVSGEDGRVERSGEWKTDGEDGIACDVRYDPGDEYGYGFSAGVFKIIFEYRHDKICNKELLADKNPRLVSNLARFYRRDWGPRGMGAEWF